MKLKAYSVYDSATELYTKPFFLRTPGEAIRSFQSEANNPESQIHQHAEDYTLFEVGEYDEATGALSPQTPKSLGNALEYIRRPESDS